MKKRMITVVVVFGLLSLALAGRLAYIQIVGGEALSAAAIRQQKISLDGIDFRGTIYDRHMSPLTSQTKEYMLLLLKDKYDSRVATILSKMDAHKLSVDNSKYYVYAVDHYDKDTWDLLEKNYNAYSLEVNKRYDNNQLASHLIGYINQKDGNGVSGLELLYNKKLENNDSNYFAMADAKGYLLSGIGISASVNQNYGIVTTIDKDIQKSVEKVLEDSKYNGAVVVQSVKDGSILACASTPAFDPNEMKQYMKSDNKELIDKVFQGEYPPGSIFKIVVAAAAFEKGIKPDITLHCDGKIEINGVSFGCSTGGDSGHGDITLTDAFADSCNCAFIELGQKVGAEDILKMAEKMGLDKDPIVDFPNIKNGYLPDIKNCQGAGIGNLSIGQGETLVTPLQLARMVNIIANDGLDKNVKIVKEVLGDPSNEDQENSKINNTDYNRVISKNTAAELTKMMKATMKYGTGDNVTTTEETAGKTGSAEASDAGKYLVHGWFAGFYPASDPKYTVVVFAENGRSGRKSAVPIFDELTKMLP